MISFPTSVAIIMLLVARTVSARGIDNIPEELQALVKRQINNMSNSWVHQLYLVGKLSCDIVLRMVQRGFAWLECRTCEVKH